MANWWRAWSVAHEGRAYFSSLPLLPITVTST